MDFGDRPERIKFRINLRPYFFVVVSPQGSLDYAIFSDDENCVCCYMDNPILLYFKWKPPVEDGWRAKDGIIVERSLQACDYEAT